MKTSLIIPAYHPTKELEAMTLACIDSIVDVPDEIIVQLDEVGEGYSKTTNKALRLAKGDILIVGNNDLTFPEKWIAELLKPLNNGYDIATCWTSDQKDIEVKQKIEGGAKFGSLFAMTREVYETLGGFDEQFKGYFSDTDYRRRALDAGFAIGKNLNLVVQHEAKATYKQTDPDDNEFQEAKLLYEIKYGYAQD